MLKRTKGRLLLTLLVITGFAGTVNDSTLTPQERKFVVRNLKDTKTDLLKTIRSLSENQLNFKPSADQWSIKEIFYHLTLAENSLWTTFETSIKAPATPEKRNEIKISDDAILKEAIDINVTNHFRQAFHPQKANWRSINDAVADFKVSKLKHLKYLKTTTEDFRNHVVELPFGWVDSYQLIIFMSQYSNRQIQQINELMTDPRFPEK